jgi:hypothetical protein
LHPLEHFGHFRFKMQATIEHHIGFGQARNIALAGLIQVWIDSRPHQPKYTDALAANILDNVGDHANCSHYLNWPLR